MEDMGDQRCAGRTEDEGHLNGPRTKKRRCNGRPHSAPTDSVNGAQLTEACLNARNIEQPAVTLRGLLLQPKGSGSANMSNIAS